MPKPEQPTLTQKQQEVFNLIQNYIDQHGQSPTIKELKGLLKVSSIRSVTQYLQSLQKKGLIKREHYQTRGISLTNRIANAWSEVVSIPIVGNAGCDNLSVYADELNGETVVFDRKFLDGYDPKQVIAIRAIGDSMIEAGINSGDLVLTELTTDVKSGEDIVATIDGNAVIKRVAFTKDAIVLNPVSSDLEYKPIIMKKDFQISGRVIKVISNPNNTTDLVYEEIK